MGTLYLVSTPIGNLEDITLRAIRTLREASLIACEDTRRTAVLLRHYGIETPMLSYHEHNAVTRQAPLLDHLASGDLALVSDAGTPGLSDPGYRLVRAAIAAGCPVVPVPGPSALLAAVTASGLVPDAFTFVGFLPRRAGEASRLLSPLAPLAHPLVFYEAPHRLLATLERLRAALGDRPAVAARELTKHFEEIRRSSLTELIDHFQVTPARGEFVVIVDGAADSVGEQPVEALLLARLTEGQSPSQAARSVAQLSGRPRAELYQIALGLADRPSRPGSTSPA